MPQPGRGHQLLTVCNRGKLHAPSDLRSEPRSGTIVETSVDDPRVTRQPPTAVAARRSFDRGWGK